MGLALAMHPGSFSATSESSLSINNGPGFPSILCDVTCFQFDLVTMQLLLQEGVMSVF